METKEIVVNFIIAKMNQMSLIYQHIKTVRLETYKLFYLDLDVNEETFLSLRTPKKLIIKYNNQNANDSQKLGKHPVRSQLKRRKKKNRINYTDKLKIEGIDEQKQCVYLFKCGQNQNAKNQSKDKISPRAENWFNDTKVSKVWADLAHGKPCKESKQR